MKILLIVWNFYPNSAYTNHTKVTVRNFRDSETLCDVAVFNIKLLSDVDEMALNDKSTVVNLFLRMAVAVLCNYRRLVLIAKEHDIIYCNLVNQCDNVFINYTFIKIFFVERGVAESKLQVYLMIVDPNSYAGIETQNVRYQYIAYCRREVRLCA